VGEIERLLGRLPQKGLIVDLRGNPGGLIWAAERALQPSPTAGSRRRDSACSPPT
jgi:C-terminal processing protease CtpA/Prc